MLKKKSADTSNEKIVKEQESCEPKEDSPSMLRLSQNESIYEEAIQASKQKRLKTVYDAGHFSDEYSPAKTTVTTHKSSRVHRKSKR